MAAKLKRIFAILSSIIASHVPLGGHHFVLTDPLEIGFAYPFRLVLNGISSLVPVSNSAHDPAQTA